MDELNALNPDKKFISWQTLFLMALCTVIGLDDIMFNFQNQGMAVIFSWIVMVLFYVIPYSLMVGQLGSAFSTEGGGLSSWVRGTDGEFLGYFTAWTYWAASIPYAVDSANEVIVDLGWALTGSEKFQDQIPNSLFALLTFVTFIVFIIIEHHFSNSMEFLSTIGGGLMVIMTILFVVLAFVGLAKSGGHMATTNFTWKDIFPKFDWHYFSTIAMLIYAMNGAYYAFKMIGHQYGWGNFLLYLWAWTSFFFNCALLAVLLDAMTRMLISDTGSRYMPKFLRKKDKNGLPINGYILTVALSSFIMILGIFLPDMNDIFNWLLNLNAIVSPGVTCWIFYSFMRVRKDSKKFPSKYVFIKNDKIAYAVGLILLLVTAIATIMGITPQDVPEGSSIWWYELIINIVAVIVLIGLGAILPGIRHREVEYGIAFDKVQWISMIAITMCSIIFGIYLGGLKHLSGRGIYIAVEGIFSLLIVWLIGRRKPNLANGFKAEED